LTVKTCIDSLSWGSKQQKIVNQEDSLYFNKSAIERGLFKSTSLKKFKVEINKNQSTSQDDVFMKPIPDEVTGLRHGSYDKLNDKGYVPEEVTVHNGDIIMAKLTPIQPVEGSNKKYKDSSVPYISHAPGVVDKVYTNIYNNEGFEMRKMRVRSERIPQTGDKFACYTPEHDILTSDGWVSIKDITIDHKIACLINGTTLEYHKPIKTMNYDYNGDIYVIDSNQVKLRVTPNHRMYVSTKNGSYKIEEARHIYGKRRKYIKNISNYIPTTISENLIYTNDIPTHFKLEDLTIELKDWLILFGIWIAEGCVMDTSANFAIHKECVKDALTKCINNIGIQINHNNDILNKWNITDNRFVKYFKSLSVGAIHKSLPLWVWSLTIEQCKTLIHGMMLGNEHTMQNGSRYYDTLSIKLANDFQKLCLHAGYSTNIIIEHKAGHTSIRKTTEHEGDIFKLYRLIIIEKQNNPLVNKTKKLDKYEHYEGKVYCCQVPNDGIIYVRKDGYPVWCGNSRHGQKGTCGILMKHSDLPYTKEGITPDIIVNPNAIPSRMTIGQIIECVLGKVVANKGTEADGTPFGGLDIESVKDELEKLGYNRNGTEEMYNGMTGQKMKMQIFIGPTYYQRLKHLVLDKIHCLTDDHEVLTLNGWIKINTVTLNDEIATLENGELKYRKPLNVYHYPNYNGKLYIIKTDEVELKVTYNHRMWVSLYDENNSTWSKYDFHYAKDIIGKRVKYLNIDKEIEVNKENIIEEQYIDYNGAVHCVEVPSNIFYVKHNNKTVWTGNSRARGPRTLLTRQAPEGVVMC